MRYCNLCDNFEYDDTDGYYCCIIGRHMKIAFDMDSLNRECPKRKVMDDGMYVYEE